MTPEEIQQIIDMLAEKLGPLAQTVWEAYLKQVYIQAAQNAFLGILLIIGGCIGLAIGYKCFKQRQVIVAARKSQDRYGHAYGDTIDQELGMGLGFGLGSTATVLGVFILSFCVQILNPEYTAIQMLLGR
jgi:uncharacterized membrane protein